MNLLEAIRAKSKKEDKNFLLKDHIIEVIKRGLEVKEFIDKNNIYSDTYSDEFFESLIKAAFLHDLGKILYRYQKEFYRNEEIPTELENILISTKIINIRHEILSVIWSAILIEGNTKWSKWIRTATLLHHYNIFYIDEKDLDDIFENYPEIEKYIDFIENNFDLLNNFIEEIKSKIFSKFNNNELIRNSLSSINLSKNRINELKEKIKKKVDISDFAEFYEIDNDNPDYNFFVFLGTLRRCDYSASGEFSIEEIKDLEEKVYRRLNEKIKEIIKKEVIWQEKILKENDSEKIILIAPTGSGKTEFALLWAKNRGKKLIYTLPLRVALNDLYENRFRNNYFLPNQENKEIVGLLHSTSFIEYLNGKREYNDIDVGTKISIAKTFSYPILLTTPDQVFLTSLKYYGFDKVVSIYPLSSIIIDEIQAYNPEMAAVIIKTLEIIKELNGNILIITATFPPYFREFIKYKIIDLKELIENNQISKEEIKNYSTKRHKIKLIKESLFDYQKNNKNDLWSINEKAFEVIKTQLNKDKNILIIVNNVGKAIQLYKKFESEINDKKLYLLHSRIIEKEKNRRIKELKNKLNNGEKGIVLIATQIVEASVDVDFDVLFTEISPIESQIQRWGRICRNRSTEKYNIKDSKSFSPIRKEDDKNIEEPNIFIFVGKEDNKEKRIDRGTEAIYDKKTTLKTIEILKQYENKELDYEQERELIEKVYNGELLEYYKNEIKKNLDWLKYYSAEKRSEAQKIFRNIGGIQVFIKDLSIDDQIYNAFCKVLKNKENWKLPLDSEKEDSIIKKVKNEIKDENIKKQINKWTIKQILYEYSFNLPIFGLKLLEKNMFKGFFILTSKNKDQLKEFLKYGVNKIEFQNLDELEIEEVDEFII